MFWGDGGEHGEEEGKRERDCERQGIGTGVMLSTIVVERGEEWKEKGRAGARGGQTSGSSLYQPQARKGARDIKENWSPTGQSFFL